MQQKQHAGPFVYAEIGLGNGTTFAAAADVLSQLGADFQMHGVDLPNYAGDCLDMRRMGPHATRMQMHFIGAGAFFATFPGKADFVFIDGCHGKACVTADFEGAERIVNVGGVVVFHDTDPLCQGLHHQPHCGTGIDARAAVRDLGLLGGSRPNWKRIGETSGNKLRGGHGCLFVQRV